MFVNPKPHTTPFAKSREDREEQTSQSFNDGIVNISTVMVDVTWFGFCDDFDSVHVHYSSVVMLVAPYRRRQFTVQFVVVVL